MKEQPILFSGPMVRALLAGTKTQTRRIIKPSWSLCLDLDHDPEDRDKARDWCPYGAPGDRLWVRETWRTEELEAEEEGEVPAGTDGVRFRADNAFVSIENTAAAADLWVEAHERDGRWRPSIFMRRWMCRLVLEVTGVRVERLQDISEEDAAAEGVDFVDGPWGKVRSPPGRESFRLLWEQINGFGSWDANPWVWVVSFRSLP